MEKDKNAFIKILIVLVIASLALLVIVYMMISTKKTLDETPLVNIELENPIQNDVLLEEKEKLPAFAEIKNYKFSKGITSPVSCKHVNNEFSNLENELNVSQTGYLNYVYNDFVLTSVENKYNWTVDDFMATMKKSTCGSSIFYGSIEDGKYLIFARCAGVDALGTNKNDYSTLVGNCTVPANDIYEYFGGAMVGSSLIEKTW